MIDKKTRKKILDLWKKGESKASIQRKTRVSQPTIRKILQATGSDEIMIKDRTDLDSSNLEKRITRLEEEVKYLKLSREDTLNNKSAHSSHCLPQKDIFTINLERNTPYLDNPPFLMMRNGLPLYDLPRVLGLVYPASIANAIVGKIEDLGGRGHTYEVQITHHIDGIPDIFIQPI